MYKLIDKLCALDVKKSLRRQPKTVDNYIIKDRIKC